MGAHDEIERRNLAPPHLTERELEELVFECLERIEVEGADALERICREHASDAPQLLERVRALVERGLLDVAPPLRTPRNAFMDALGEGLGGEPGPNARSGD